MCAPFNLINQSSRHKHRSGITPRNKFLAGLSISVASFNFPFIHFAPLIEGDRGFEQPFLKSLKQGCICQARWSAHGNRLLVDFDEAIGIDTSSLGRRSYLVVVA